MNYVRTVYVYAKDTLIETLTVFFLSDACG